MLSNYTEQNSPDLPRRRKYQAWCSTVLRAILSRMKNWSPSSLLSLVKSHWLLLAILCVGLVLRGYRLPEMASYDFDQEYNTRFVLQVVREYPVRYVGQGLSIQGLFMGPFYFYYLVPFYLLLGLNPVGGTVASVLLGLVIIVAYYLVGKALFSTKAGLLAASIRAVGFYAISADWSTVPSYGSDLSVLLSWWLLYQIWSGKQQYLPPLFFVFGMFSSFHPVQLPFILVFLLLSLFWKLRFSLKAWTLSLIAFVVPITPLLLFEYWRNWAMIRVVLDAATNGSSTSSTNILANTLEKSHIVLEHWSTLWSLPPDWSLVSLVLACGCLWYLWKHTTHTTSKKLAFHLPALATVCLVFILYYSFLPFNVPEYYLRGTQAIFLLYMGALLAYISTKKLGWLFVAAVLLLSIWQNGSKLYARWHQTNLTTLAYKQRVIDHIIAQANGQAFQVSYIVQPGWGSGFETLFAVAHQQPGDDGPVYSIIVPMIELEDDTYDFTSGGIGVTYPD